MLRESVVLNVSGTLEIGAHSLLSYGTIVHCADDVRIGSLVGVAEYVTIVDSTHFLTEPDVRHFDNVRTQPGVDRAQQLAVPESDGGIRASASATTASSVRASR